MDELITPRHVLEAYTLGLFPMAEHADDPHFHWVEPKMRGILPLHQFHLSKRMQRFVRNHPYTLKVDCDFLGVIEACAAPRIEAETGEFGETWINPAIKKLYHQLFEMGFCHSVEVYEGATLVGGLYGVAIGGAFFGESMFHRVRDTSKLALAHLVARLKYGGYRLLDTQFITTHLQQFGAIEIPQEEYRVLLGDAFHYEGDFFALDHLHP